MENWWNIVQILLITALLGLVIFRPVEIIDGGDYDCNDCGDCGDCDCDCEEFDYSKIPDCLECDLDSLIFDCPDCVCEDCEEPVECEECEDCVTTTTTTLPEVQCPEECLEEIEATTSDRFCQFVCPSDALRCEYEIVKTWSTFEGEIPAGERRSISSIQNLEECNLWKVVVC